VLLAIIPCIRVSVTLSRRFWFFLSPFGHLLPRLCPSRHMMTSLPLPLRCGLFQRQCIFSPSFCRTSILSSDHYSSWVPVTCLRFSLHLSDHCCFYPFFIFSSSAGTGLRSCLFFLSFFFVTLSSRPSGKYRFVFRCSILRPSFPFISYIWSTVRICLDLTFVPPRVSFPYQVWLHGGPISERLRSNNRFTDVGSL